MNSYRISGTLSVVLPDGEMIELGVVGSDEATPLLDGSKSINWASNASGTFTISTTDSAAAERLFNEMQAEYLRQQFQEAMREASLQMRTGHLGAVEGVRFIDTHDLSRALRYSMPAPVYYEPRRKVAQWKRERSPLRYS